jgi:formiminoglutamase
MYKNADPEIWSGRIDDTKDKSSFRFHQMVSFNDVSNLPKDGNNLVLIGFESDEGVRRNKGRIGAADAPNVIKEMLAKLPYNIGEKETIDAGNVVCVGKELEKA